MKKLVRYAPYILYPAQISAVLADHYKGIIEAGNFAMFTIWVVIILSLFIVSFCDDDTFRETPKDRLVTRILCFSLILTLIWCGWSVTAAFYLICWVLLAIKRME